jgi:dTDP-4-dehydrorhamnose reductase
MVLVLGENGQVANALRAQFGDAFMYLGSKDANFLEPKSVLEALNRLKPTLIINAAAYTAVDLAEKEQDQCRLINATTPGEIANWCSKNNAKLVHFSTDYVFNGRGTEPWIEDSPTDPINFYGLTKLEGEKAIQQVLKEHYIFRVSWVYSPWGKNFVKTILRLAQEREELSIVNDQIGAPTDAREIARFIFEGLNTEFNAIKLNSGLYNLAFQSPLSWYEFAIRIIERAKLVGLPIKVKEVKAIATSQYPTPAVRPLNSRMKTGSDEAQNLVDKVSVSSQQNLWCYSRIDRL